MLKYLRIAVTVLSLTACVLISALWVRSYWWNDTVFGVIGSERLQLTSNCADLQLFVCPKAMFTVPPKWDYMRFIATPIPSKKRERIVARRLNAPLQGIELSGRHYLAVAFAALLAGVPWIGWSTRFSLRTLLIATTLVAVALAAIVYASR